MEALTIRIVPFSEGGYYFDVYACELDEAQSRENEGSASDDGGLCTTTIADALEMANEATLRVIRNHYADNCFNADICPSSLDENGVPMIDGDTEHKWHHDDEEDENAPATCSECGAEQIIA